MRVARVGFKEDMGHVVEEEDGVRHAQSAVVCGAPRRQDTSYLLAGASPPKALKLQHCHYV